MFKYYLLLFTCISFAVATEQRIEEMSYGSYHGYYDNDTGAYVINKGEGLYVGIKDGAQLTNEQGKVLFEALQEMYKNQQEQQE